MDAKADCNVKVDCQKISCCPKFFPCPHCGKRGRRKQRLKRSVRSIAYGKIVYLEVTYGEYRATCDCCSIKKKLGTFYWPR